MELHKNNTCAHSDLVGKDHGLKVNSVNCDFRNYDEYRVWLLVFELLRDLACGDWWMFAAGTIHGILRRTLN